MHPRVRAICDLRIPSAREYAGLHDYDGVVQDLTVDGVRAGLARLGGDPLDDDHDDALVGVFETGLRVRLGELEEHRRNPLVHISNLELSSYLRPYAPEEVRRAGMVRHLRGWPDAVDAAVGALDRVPADVATGLLGSAAALADDLPATEDADVVAARAAHRRLLAHLERCAAAGDPDAALGSRALERLLAATEGTEVDLGRLAERADAERERLRTLLAEACARLRPGLGLRDAVASLQGDHPTIDGVLDEARALTAEVLAWTASSGIIPPHEGECLVGPAPGSRKWVMAAMSPAAPLEPDGPSWYQITPPEPDWPVEQQDEWLAVFNRASMPAITVHEVAPGHYTHWRLLRRVDSVPRRVLHSDAFVEGWAHHAEELAWEEGFRPGDPAYVAGMAIEALIRVTRLAVSIGLHTGAMTLDEASARFTDHAFIAGPAARGEAVRATFDPTYGRYTWGKLAIRSLRDRARRRWGTGYSDGRFHAGLLALGAPPLGLMSRMMEDARQD